MTETKQQIDISVVICAYTDERWHDLARAIESVRSQSCPPREIIIVVDHNPALLERVQVTFPDVKAVENMQARGASGSKNTGLIVSEGRFVAYLDDDAVASPNWLKHLHAGYENERVIGVGGSLEPLWPGKRPVWFPEEFDWVVGCTYRGMPERSGVVRNLIGANMSFRREVLEHVGGLYTGIGHVGGNPIGGSDPELCIRINQSFPGKVLLYKPEAHVGHRVSEKRTYWSYFCKRCYNEGRSKALLTERLGSKDGLSSERTYVMQALPLAVMRGFRDTITTGDLNGLKRAGTVVAGLAVTTAGYVVGRLDQLREAARQSRRRQLPAAQHERVS